MGAGGWQHRGDSPGKSATAREAALGPEGSLTQSGDLLERAEVGEAGHVKPRAMQPPGGRK